MLFGSVLMSCVGIFVSTLGYQIWGRKKISLIYNTYHDKVSDEDQRAFCIMWGIGLNLIGIGFLLTGILAVITKASGAFIAVEVGVLLGLILMILASARYNN